MALDIQEQDYVRRGKRKRMNGRRKLLVNERVEVRSVEDGFLGSWHPGTVIACGKHGRSVRYNHLLTDDGSASLVDIVGVSPIVDGIGCANENQCTYRGSIRPLPPLLEFGEYGLPYGLCVDVYYKEAWWEGVIFDHEDGSEERKIFFPDLGDEMTTGVDALRITQDWDELTAIWQRRGTWLFLELIEEYEKEWYLAVSVKQIWYDVRVKEGFGKIGEWTSSVRVLWEALVLEAIHDNLKITVNHFLRVLGHLGSLQEEIQPLLEFAKPAVDVHMYPEADLAKSHAVVPIESLLNPNSTSVQPVQEKSDLDQLISVSDDGQLNLNLLTESNVSCHNKAVQPIRVPPQDLSLSPSNPYGISGIGSVTSGEGFSSSCLNKMNGTPLSSTVQNMKKWLPAGSDMVPGAEFCPDFINKYALMGSKQPRNTIIIGVRKHLSSLGWKIEYTKDEGMQRQRLRYTSPDGKTYFSLRQLCLDMLKPTMEDLSPNSQNDQRSLHTSPHSSLSLPLEQPQQYQNPDYCPQAVNSSHPDVVIVEPEYCPQAIVDWYDIGLNHKGVDKSPLILKAKKHLSALGWVFWYSEKKVKRELCYRSPRGRMYNSLRAACKACMDESGVSEINATCRPMENINVTEEVQDQLASKNLSSAVSDMEFQRSFVPSNALAENQLAESSCISPSRKIVELGRGIRKLRRERKDKLSHLVSHSLQTKSNKRVQNASFPKLKGGKTSGTLIKLKDDLEGSFPNRVLRSSKRVQQVVFPTSSHHNPRTVLSWLIDNNVILPRAKVHYCRRKDRHPLAEGRITRDGIKCNCCGKVYTLSNFEVHAGSTCHRPAANIFLEDGRSLLDCQMQIKLVNKPRNFKAVAHDRLKGNWHQRENDYICSVCHYGGELILCDQCPSSFHKSCLGLKDVPDGDWFCPSCCCGICGQSNFKEDTEHFMNDTVLDCHQCEHKYHVRCIRNRGADKLETCFKENWFCSKKCKEIFLGLRKLLGKPIPVGLGNLTWTLVKYMQSDSCELDASNFEALTENYSKLNVALSVMHECFELVKETHTGRDLVEDVIFSRRSELKRLNFRGFYTVLLQKNDELVSVATVRIYGEKVAELPLVGTRFQYRRLGMCRILVDELEKKLVELGIQRLILPAVPSVLNTWTTSFGFSKMTDSERLQFLDYTFLDFQDTVMCQKLLIMCPSAELSLSRGTQPGLCDDACGSGDNIDFGGSYAVSEVLEAKQIEESEIVDHGLLEVAVGNGSRVCEGPAHLVDMVNQPTQLEYEPYEPCDANLRQAGQDGGNLYIKCYKRRRILASES